MSSMQYLHRTLWSEYQEVLVWGSGFRLQAEMPVSGFQDSLEPVFQALRLWFGVEGLRGLLMV